MHGFRICPQSLCTITSFLTRSSFALTLVGIFSCYRLSAELFFSGISPEAEKRCRVSKFNSDFSVALETVVSKASYLYPISETNYAIFPYPGAGGFLWAVFGFSQVLWRWPSTQSILSHTMSERKRQIPCRLTYSGRGAVAS